MKFYYDVHVQLEANEGYSVGVVSDVELDDDAVINLASKENKFEEAWDADLVDTVDSITEEQYLEWFGKSEKIV